MIQLARYRPYNKSWNPRITSTVTRFRHRIIYAVFITTLFLLKINFNERILTLQNFFFFTLYYVTCESVRLLNRICKNPLWKILSIKTANAISKLKMIFYKLLGISNVWKTENRNEKWNFCDENRINEYRKNWVRYSYQMVRMIFTIFEIDCRSVSKL